MHLDSGGGHTVSWPGTHGTEGTRLPLTNQGEVDVHLIFQYHFYSNQYPLPNHVKPIHIQLIFHVASILVTSPNPEIWGTCDIIILSYFYLLLQV